MSAIATAAFGFGPGERTLAGAGRLAREMCPHSDRSPSEDFFTAAAGELLAALIFCAAHGDLETTDTVDRWIVTLTATSTRDRLTSRLRTITDAFASTADQRTDAQGALERLERRTSDDRRAAAAIQTTAIVALRDWTRRQTTNGDPR